MHGCEESFSSIDNYVWWTILRWLARSITLVVLDLLDDYGWRKRPGGCIRWRDGAVAVFETPRQRVRPYRLGWMKVPDFAKAYGEPDA